MPTSVFSWAADDSETLAGDLLQPGSWVEVDRDEATSSVTLQHFSSLFTDPMDVRASLRPIPPNLSNRLNRCRFQYSLSFISALMARDGSKQLQTRQLGGEKSNCCSLYGFRTPRMATSTIDKTHARDNHSCNIKFPVRQRSAEPKSSGEKNSLKTGCYRRPKSSVTVTTEIR
jgi:hypothetical protein